MRKLIFLVFICSFSKSFAQDSSKVSTEEVNILYRNEAEGGLTIHSAGFGITFKRGWHVTGYSKRMFEADLVSMRHPKQYKQPNPYYRDSRPFFFGKINFVYLMRGGFGKQNVIFSKGERSGVEVRYNYYAGVDLGITKPVYLDILPNDSSTEIVTKAYDPNDPEQRDVANIYGPGPYFMGFDKLKVYPGVYGKFAISFEYGGWQQKVTALETGIVVDYFPKAIPIMAFNKNENLYFNFYFSFMWGGKW